MGREARPPARRAPELMQDDPATTVVATRRTPLRRRWIPTPSQAEHWADHVLVRAASDTCKARSTA